MYFIGVDVGTGSARAGVFDHNGVLLGQETHTITTYHPAPNWAEQNSEQIWQSVCFVVKSALSQANIAGEKVIGIGFDATCSLVIRDKHFQPLSLSKQGFDVMLWADQRAVGQAEICNQTKAKPLDFVGGKMSPEMQMPKLLWLKNNRLDLWEQLGYAGDLSDFLTYKATGNNVRSQCTLVCKWGYLAQSGWDLDFLHQIGLDDVRDKAKLPDNVLSVGNTAGKLSPQAAHDLGLSTNCQVASAMIDAHAGAVASFSAFSDEDIEQTLSLVAGTSNCHMAMSSDLRAIKGVWGAYDSVVRNEFFLNEGGQTTTGALLNYLIEQFSGSQSFLPNIHQAVTEEIFAQYQLGKDIAPDCHILPDFLGNRAPFANPHIKGIIAGIDFSTPRTLFIQLYWAACCSIAYGTRHIMEVMAEQGYNFKRIVLTGGHRQSSLLTQLYADTTGCDLVLLDCAEPVLLGSAMLGAKAAGVETALTTMKPTVSLVKANKQMKAMHDARYQQFLRLYKFYENYDLS